MHISERIKAYFSENNWVWADFDGVTVATQTIRFDKLAGQLTNGERLVKIKMNETGRWLEIVDGWEMVLAEIDLRNYWEKTAHEAVSDLIRMAYPV